MGDISLLDHGGESVSKKLMASRVGLFEVGQSFEVNFSKRDIAKLLKG